MQPQYIVILICSNVEWKALLKIINYSDLKQSPYGEYFMIDESKSYNIIYFNTGCGKVNAGGGTQYVCDRWNPELIINLGTCGGFEGLVKVGDILLANETAIYDISEELGEIEETMEHYRTIVDISWIKNREILSNYKKSIIISSDKDIDPEEIKELKNKFNAIATDWESGSVAHIAGKNKTKCLILRGVSDIVGKNKAEMYGNNKLFEERSAQIMKKILKSKLMLNLDYIV